MSLSNRTFNVLKSAMADKASATEVSSKLAPFAGTVASFKGIINVEGGGTAVLTVDANAVGIAGNTSITGDGLTDCATLIGAGYTVYEGGAVILKNGDAVSISGGQDAVAAGGALSTRTKKLIAVAMCDKRASDALIYAIENDSALDARSKQLLRVMLCDKRAYDEISALM